MDFIELCDTEYSAELFITLHRFYFDEVNRERDKSMLSSFSLLLFFFAAPAKHENRQQLFPPSKTETENYISPI